MPNFGFNQNEILTFALVLIRVSCFLVASPFFSHFQVPQMTKILSAVCLSILIFPVILQTGPVATIDGDALIWMAGKEAIIGIIIGFVARCFFFALSVAGQMISASMGLSNAQIFNPASAAMTTTIEQFYDLIAFIVWLSIQGHHALFVGLVRSFEVAPIGPDGIKVALFNHSDKVVSVVIESGVKIAAPVLIAILIVNLTMAVVGRAVPQMNVLMTAIPVTLFIGLVVMMITMPALMLQLDKNSMEFTKILFDFVTGL